MTDAWTYNADGSYQIVYTGVTGKSYTSVEDVYDSAGVQVAVAVANSNGTGALTLEANGVGVALGQSQLSVTVGDDFNLNAYADASTTIAATGFGAETFAFAPNFGNDAISGFVASGLSADAINLTASAFGLQAGAQNQTADWQALVANGPNGSLSQSNGSAVITNTLGDKLTFAGVTEATLKAHPGGFNFV